MAQINQTSQKREHQGNSPGARQNQQPMEQDNANERDAAPAKDAPLVTPPPKPVQDGTKAS